MRIAGTAASAKRFSKQKALAQQRFEIAELQKWQRSMQLAVETIHTALESRGDLSFGQDHKVRPTLAEIPFQKRGPRVRTAKISKIRSSGKTGDTLETASSTYISVIAWRGFDRSHRGTVARIHVIESNCWEVVLNKLFTKAFAPSSSNAGRSNAVNDGIDLPFSSANAVVALCVFDPSSGLPLNSFSEMTNAVRHFVLPLIARQTQQPDSEPPPRIPKRALETLKRLNSSTGFTSEELCTFDVLCLEKSQNFSEKALPDALAEKVFAKKHIIKHLNYLPYYQKVAKTLGDERESSPLRSRSPLRNAFNLKPESATKRLGFGDVLPTLCPQSADCLFERTPTIIQQFGTYIPGQTRCSTPALTDFLQRRRRKVHLSDEGDFLVPPKQPQALLNNFRAHTPTVDPYELNSFQRSTSPPNSPIFQRRCKAAPGFLKEGVDLNRGHQDSTFTMLKSEDIASNQLTKTCFAPRVTMKLVSNIAFPLGIMKTRFGDAVRVEGGEPTEGTVVLGVRSGDLFSVEKVSHGVEKKKLGCRLIMRALDPLLKHFVEIDEEFAHQGPFNVSETAVRRFVQLKEHRFRTEEQGAFLEHSPAADKYLDSLKPKLVCPAALCFLTDKRCDLDLTEVQPTTTFSFILWIDLEAVLQLEQYSHRHPPHGRSKDDIKMIRSDLISAAFATENNSRIQESATVIVV